MRNPVFDDRRSAGTQLGAVAARLALDRPVVLGLPRGGIPVAAELARGIRAPLDAIVVRKLGVPQQPELAMGAIGEEGVVVVNDEVVRASRVDDDAFGEVVRRERDVLDRTSAAIRAVRPREPLAGVTAVIVDDGIATGATIRAAIEVARANAVGRVVIATPVAPPEVAAALGAIADVVICLMKPERFRSVGQWYEHFGPVSQADVLELLERFATAGPS
jgi:putative phosphoribosyl transferase